MERTTVSPSYIDTFVSFGTSIQAHQYTYTCIRWVRSLCPFGTTTRIDLERRRCTTAKKGPPFIFGSISQNQESFVNTRTSNWGAFRFSKFLASYQNPKEGFRRTESVSGIFQYALKWFELVTCCRNTYQRVLNRDYLSH